jgi:cytochrome c551/c552
LQWLAGEVVVRRPKEPKKEEAKTDDLSKNPDYQKGLELIAKNDCFTCHQIDDKLNGPPYREGSQ